MYAQNKIVPRTSSLKVVPWSSQRLIATGIIEMDGEFTFDFFNEEDRARWLGAFTNEKGKRDTGDRFFAARELVVNDYITKTMHNQFIKDIVPRSMAESPRSFLYNDLIGRMAIEKNFIIPALHKTGVFSPITEHMERMFFEFVQDSYTIETMEIPDMYVLRQIFRVKFRVLFDLKKYLDYLIIKKKAKFELNLWPDCYIKMTYGGGWPMIFLHDKINFYNAVNQHVLKIIQSTPSIINYIYSTIKIRVDRVAGLQLRLDHKSQDVLITTDRVMSLIGQFIAGKIDIFSNQRINSSFSIQKMDPEIARKYGTSGTSPAAVFLLNMYALRYISSKRPGLSHPSASEVERVMRDIKSGKIKIDRLK